MKLTACLSFILWTQKLHNLRLLNSKHLQTEGKTSVEILFVSFHSLGLMKLNTPHSVNNYRLFMNLSSKVGNFCHVRHCGLKKTKTRPHWPEMYRFRQQMHVVVVVVVAACMHAKSRAALLMRKLQKLRYCMFFFKKAQNLQEFSSPTDSG